MNIIDLGSLAADGSTPPVTIINPGKVGFFVAGDLGSGTLKLEASHDNSTWVDYPSGSLALGYKEFDVVSPYLRATLSSASDPAVTVVATKG